MVPGEWGSERQASHQARFFFLFFFCFPISSELIESGFVLSSP